MKRDDDACEAAITVLIVDDHAMYREGLCELIAHWNDFRVVGLAANGLEGVEMYRELQPDIVLMDVHMPGMNGAEAVGCILEGYPSARVVMMTVSRVDADLLDALQSGACGYMLKEACSQQLYHLLEGWAADGPPARRKGSPVDKA